MRKIIAIFLLFAICMPSICYASSSITVTISDATYSYYSTGDAPEYNKHAIFKSSTGNPVYCGNHAYPTPVGDNIGDSKSLEIHEYKNETVRKILYYGYLGPKEWSGFSDSKYNGVYKAGSAANKRKWCGNAVTGIALTKTQTKGYVYDISGLNAFWKYIDSAPEPPKGFKAYIMYGNSNQQNLFTWMYKPEGTLTIKKEIASNNRLVEECQEQYSLNGAEYVVSTDDAGQNIVGKLVTNSAGLCNTLTLSPGVYYIRETVAPKGFGVDEKVYKINVEEDKENIINVKDEPLFNEMDYLLLKKDSESDEGLEGAIIQVNYYKKHLDDVTGITPDKTWLFRTDSNGKISLNDDYKVGGDDLYKDDNGSPVGLIGTYEFIEKEAPCGYVKESTSVIRHIKVNESTGDSTIYNPPQISNEEQHVSIVLIKNDMECENNNICNHDLSGAVYEVRNSLGEIVGTITTDENGRGQLHGLKLGTYTLKEVKAPDGYLINTESIIIEAIAKDDLSKSFEYIVEVGEQRIKDVEEEKTEPEAEKKVPITADNSEYLMWYKMLIMASLGIVISNAGLAGKKG